MTDNIPDELTSDESTLPTLGEVFMIFAKSAKLSYDELIANGYHDVANACEYLQGYVQENTLQLARDT